MRYMDYPPFYNHYSFWPDGILSLLITVLFWAAVVSLFLFLVKKMTGHTSGRCCGMRRINDTTDDEEEADAPTYMYILKERYAKGEIDKQKFEEMKKDLAG